jgi:Fe-S cluster assembly ATP-binding protein
MMKMKRGLYINGLKAFAGTKQLLHNVNIHIKPGEIHALMGPNGSGKSTLCHALVGDPSLKVEGKAMLDGEDILSLDIDERARKGLFLSFQAPPAVPGVSVANYLRTIYNAARPLANPISIAEFEKIAKKEMAALHMDESFLDRYLNDGFSGGEKKRCEILQMALLQPKCALLDEIDSGLDVDALKIISSNILRLFRERKFGLLVITHYARILKFLRPDYVHVMHKGKIVRSSTAKLAWEIEKEGYDKIIGLES